MRFKLNKGDVFFQVIDTNYYFVAVVTKVRDSHQCYGDMHIFTKDGVVTEHNRYLNDVLNRMVPLSRMMYRKITNLIDLAQFEITSILLNAKNMALKILQENSCFVFIRVDGLWSVNRVLSIEPVKDETTGCHFVKHIDHEVVSETFAVGNRTFKKQYTPILLNQVDEDEDFIISRKTYDKIVGLHTQMMTNIFTMLNVHISPVKDENGKWGYSSPDIGIEIPCQWADASPFSEGLAAVADEDRKYGYIDLTGKRILPFKWAFANPFIEGFAAVEEKWGRQTFINHQGRSPFGYWECVDFFSEGLAGVKKNGKWGFVDSKGKLVIPCKWDEVDWFHNGKAKVWNADHNPFLINTQGEVVASGTEAEQYDEGL